MEASSLLVAFGGMIAGNVLFAMLSTWGRAVAEVLRTHQSEHRWRMVLASSLFNAGPWALVAAGIFTFYEHSAPWAPWFFGGAALWLLFMGVLIAKFWSKVRGQRGKNAA